jgi:hypothetical protein
MERRRPVESTKSRRKDRSDSLEPEAKAVTEFVLDAANGVERSAADASEGVGIADRNAVLGNGAVETSMARLTWLCVPCGREKLR